VTDDHGLDPPVAPDDEPGPSGLGAGATPSLLPAREPFRSLLRWLGRAEQSVAVILLAVILALVLVQVGQRYLPRGFAWTGEVARFAMVWLTFVMSGTLLAQDAHIAIKVVDYFLPVRVLGVVKLVGHALITATCIVMLYGTYDFMTHDRGQVTAAAQIPLSLIYTVIAFGFASTAIRAILTIFVLDLPQVRTGEKASL
jgi:TRAP-type C4-dicarboxylate transport system permease small subunit